MTSKIKQFYCKKCESTQKSKVFWEKKGVYLSFCKYCGRNIPAIDKVEHVVKSKCDCGNKIRHNNKSGLCRVCYLRRYYKNG